MPLDDDLLDLLTRAKSDDAARSRAGIGSLRELALEDATLDGLLLECAEHGGRVSVRVGGRTIAGHLREVCTAGLVIDGPRTRSIIRIGAVDLLTTHGRHRPDVDPRTPLASTWTELLHRHVERGDMLEVGTSTSTARGELVTIGRELVSIECADASMVYARTESIAVVVVSSAIS